MKFSTSKTELQQALQKLSKATPTRSTLPILGCVLFEASEEKTTLRATDLEITIQVEIPVSLEKAGATALPLKTLLDITNELPETRVTFAVDDKDRAAITTDTGEYDLMAKPADEFPAVPDTPGSQPIDVSGEMLKNIIDATSFAVTSGAVTAGLTFTTGVGSATITGTQTAHTTAATDSFTVTATDAEGQTAARAFTISWTFEATGGMQFN